LIKDGNILFIDNGTTCPELAKSLLKKKDLTVSTHSLKVAQTLADNETAMVLVLGG
jgi:DeoR/GlpR family transcriptional regulator of sugar metabolism